MNSHIQAFSEDNKHGMDLFLIIEIQGLHLYLIRDILISSFQVSLFMAKKDVEQLKIVIWVSLQIMILFHNSLSLNKQPHVGPTNSQSLELELFIWILIRSTFLEDTRVLYLTLQTLVIIFHFSNKKWAKKKHYLRH